MAAKCNPDLEKERKNCIFNKEELTNILDGGKEETEKRRALEKYILEDKDLIDKVPVEYMSHEDRYANELRKACLLVKKLPGSPLGTMDTLRGINGSGIGSAVLFEGNPLAVHFVMFIPAILGQGNGDQQAKWLQKAIECNIVGTYAQTELGHGTFLRGLETTATYDPATEQFVLNSPTLTSFKWWPGGLGKTANYAVVMAQLYSKGKCHGIHAFMVQLRDEQTHEPLNGVIVGETGPKFGLNTNDNGYLGFKNYRIPRDHMMMRHAQVLPDGTYVKPASDKLSYGTMVFVRVVICQDVTKQLQKAVTIATRYSAVRRQSELRPGEPEPQVIDYVAQQHKLFPALAAVFAFHFPAQLLWNLYNNVTSGMEQGNLELLPELHAISCGLKALCSLEAGMHAEILRQSCGGHGYMTSSNLPRLYTQITAACTYEGENTVLWLQVARYLVKVQKEKKGGKSVEYLINPQTVKGSSSDLSLKGLVGLYQRVAAGLVADAVAELDQRTRAGQSAPDAWNNSAVSLISAAQAHCRYFVVDSFVKAVHETDMSAPVRSILSYLCEIYLIYWLLNNSGHFILYCGLTKNQLSSLKTKYTTLLAAVRPHAVNIVDSFDFHDRILNSALGTWDGDVYNNLFQAAQKSPLNSTAVHTKSYNDYMKPMLQSNL